MRKLIKIIDFVGNLTSESAEYRYDITTATNRVKSLTEIPVLSKLSQKLSHTYERKGGPSVASVVNDIIMRSLKYAYKRAGISEEPTEVCFDKLAKAGYIDPQTALYLTTLYMALENEIDDLEEAGNSEAKKILDKVSDKIAEIIATLIPQRNAMHIITQPSKAKTQL